MKWRIVNEVPKVERNVVVVDVVDVVVVVDVATTDV